MNVPKLRAKIAERGIKYCDVAVQMGITPQALNRKMRGDTRFFLDDAIKLCDILHITNSSERNEIFLSQSSQKRDETRM
ncbi:helix-turn-helix domain-containing protein [Megasphaera sueciensis]|jgi:transcriptional regulator with XRE-family HTH domain|uniref:helix-turn-helix domain-containing protein n=1 Tax=Megasphaera sueciensis TaxID=349094 RepID=UPI003CFC7768